MRVLVCGGRDFTNQAWLFNELDKLDAKDKITCIISGCVQGADNLAMLWAFKRKIEVAPFPADWKNLSNSAGPIRNETMIKKGRPDIILAFPGGRGTENMIMLGLNARLRVYRLSSPNEALLEEPQPPY